MKLNLKYIIVCFIIPVLILSILHYRTLLILLKPDYEISSSSNTDFNDIADGSIIAITGKPDSFFHIESDSSSKRFFALKEFGFLAIIETEGDVNFSGENTFRGYAYIAGENSDYNKIIEALNTPMNTDMLLDIGFAPSDYTTIQEKTSGAFDENTIIVDVKLSSEKDNAKFILRFGGEIFLSACIFTYFLRKKIGLENED